MDEATDEGASTSEVRVGVDVGGTFTDVVTVRDGRVTTAKVPSTPDAPERGVVDGLRERLAVDDGTESNDDPRSDDDPDAIDPAAVSFLAHGTTVATNAVLERDWADTALITTAGFRDVLEIGRQTRPDIYDLHAEKPEPVVPRNRRYEVPGRLDERGREIAPLDEERAREVAREIATGDADSVAVALLFAFEDASHERRIAEILADAAPDAAVSLSSDVLPEIREYERTLATALNAALKPVMDRYLGALESDVAGLGVGPAPRVMASGGGLVAAAAARERPVTTLLSGPAAGVQGATHVAGRCGFADVLTMDMGGTSCDVSLVRDGDPLVTTDVEVGDYPVGVPTVDVHTVGAGGGSVAWLDDGGALRVGPRSAGAAPGPICYGRGGERPTLTDAHFALGRIDPGQFVSGDLAADASAVEDAIERDLAAPLGMGVREAAQGVVDVANANMERALRVVSVERGYDPREFALVAFGGAGPLHAAELAASLDVPRVVVPPAAGVLSALGLLVTDVLYDHTTSRVRPLEAVAPVDLQDAFERFEVEGRERLADSGFDADRRRYERSVDLRYAGQSFSLSVPMPDGEVDAEALESVAEDFHERHDRRYGHSAPGDPVELVAVRLRARGVVETPTLAAPTAAGDADDAVRETRPVVFDGDETDARVYDRERLPVGAGLSGPAVVEGPGSTLVVPPGNDVTVDETGGLLLEVP